MRKGLAAFLVVLAAAGAFVFLRDRGPSFTEAERAMIASLSLDDLPPLPDDPGNAHADLPAAAAFGATLFFETRLSANGEVSCATCHLPEKLFQDGIPLARGIGTTNRRTMPMHGVAWSPWQFWDGRADSLWAQALGPLEDAAEHGGNRTAYAHFVAGEYGERYERVFGPLPELAHLPENAGPLGNEAERAAWAAMEGADREAVNRVFANIGKAIGAFGRSLVPFETRFDAFARAVAAGVRPDGDAAFSDLEIEGLRLFIGKANCLDCHNGARFTDDFFHNTGVPAVEGLPEDRGRITAVDKVLADPFNCLGPYSDAEPDQCRELRFVVRDSHEMERAFKTPSLRGAASRPPYMHAGQIETLEEVIDHYSRAPEAPAGHSELRGVIFTDRGRAALIAFLKTLDPVAP